MPWVRRWSEVLPVCKEVPIPFDMPEYRMSRFRCLVKFVETRDLVGRFTLKPAVVHMSCIATKTRSPNSYTNFGIVLSGPEYFGTANLFEQCSIFVVAVKREMHLRWRPRNTRCPPLHAGLGRHGHQLLVSLEHHPQTFETRFVCVKFCYQRGFLRRSPARGKKEENSEDG